MRHPLLPALAVAALASLPALASDQPAAAPEATPLLCAPTAVVGLFPPEVSGQVSGPQLAAVDTDVKPEHTRLYLDGRYIGQADDFDGYPDVLYLRPGRYRLECRLGGYVTAWFDVDARPGCAFTLRQKMERVQGAPKEHWWQEPAEAPAPGRVFGPFAAAPPAGSPAEPARRSGPDLSLRPDLAHQGEARSGSSLRLTVAPASAAVYLDGSFLGTGDQLAATHRPLAVTPGAHQVEVVAPGCRPHRQEVVVGAGQALELRVDLEREQVAQP